MFKDFHLRTKLEKGIENIGFTEPTEIQKKVIPLAIRRKNIVGISRTGSGKTHAFLIPILQNIKDEYKEVQTIIITPTRELASQIHQMAVNLVKESGIKIKVGLLIGGEDKRKQIDNLTIKPQIVIGTPTRIHALHKDGHVPYSTCNTLIVDEADMAFDLGFFPIIDELFSKVRESCQKMVFSATLTEQISHHISKYIKKANIVRVGDLWVHDSIDHVIVPTKGRKLDTFFKVLESIEPYMCMIFANSKKEVEEVHQEMVNRGYNAGVLHGSFQARDRKNKFKEIKNLKYKYVVCSDIASRGVDIEGASHIIHWNLPEEDEWYVHRSGRVGRAGLTGESIILYTDEDKKIIERLKNKGVKFEVRKITSTGWKSTTLAPRERRRKPITLADREVNDLYKKFRKAKKVKPGYKRKLKTQAQKIQKKHKRAIIEEQIKTDLRKKWVETSKKKKEGKN